MSAGRYEKKVIMRDTLRGTPEGPVISSVLFSRLALFWPSARNTKVCEWRSESSWGSVSVKGRLSQIHRGILDAIAAHTIVSKRESNGSMTVVINPYQVAKAAGIDASNRKWFENRLKEMRQAEIVIEEPGKVWPSIAGIISEIEEHEEGPDLRGALAGMDSHFLKINFSSLWMKIVDGTLAVRYARLLPDIAELKSGAIQAFVRHVITHTERHGSIEDTLQQINAIRDDMSRNRKNRLLAEIREASEFLSDKFGIEIKGDAFSYRQHRSVRFASPDP